MCSLDRFAAMRRTPHRLNVIFLKMDNDEFLTISELERRGSVNEAFELLSRLAKNSHPMALLDLSMRYYSVEGYAQPVFPLEPDHEKSEQLAKLAKERLEELASKNDGEAMRMLAYCYLGHWGPFLEKDRGQGEDWLLKAYDAECFVAANDLSVFYQHSNLEKSKHWYNEAETHNCRIIFNEQCEI